MSYVRFLVRVDDEIMFGLPLLIYHSVYRVYPTNPGPQLTISDLQKLEELAEEASVKDDPSRLRNVLRRSLSLNLSPSGLSNRHHHSFIRDFPYILSESYYYAHSSLLEPNSTTVTASSFSFRDSLSVFKRRHLSLN